MAVSRAGRIGEAFGLAEGYDDHATVQRQVALQLADRILALPLPPMPRILEIGCGTGLLSEALTLRITGGEWLLSDLSPAMVRRCRARLGNDPRLRFAVIDGERPKGAEGPFDLICSSLAAQWFGDLPGALERLFGLLAPGGHLAVTTLAAGTFAEWRAAHEALGLVAGTPDYPTIKALESLELGGRIEEYAIEERHADARSFLTALKAIGAGTPVAGRVPLSAGALRRVMRRFEAEGAIARYHVASCIFMRRERASSS